MYKQFSKESRIEIAALLRIGLSKRSCAKELGFDHSTIVREINKNKDNDGIYKGGKAHKKYLERRKESKQTHKKIKNDKKLRNHIKRRLKKRDSPEQIAGRVKNNDKNKYQKVSRGTIYSWIFNEEPELKK